jgi:hypothetical protein
MSSRSRIRSDRRPLRAAAALLVALIAVQCNGVAAFAAPVPLPVAAVLVSGAQTSLVVDLSASTGAGRRSVAVTRDGSPQPAKLVPVVADGLAVTIVVDTSSAGAATLPAWLSAAARFILEAPSTTDAVVIGDSAPAAAITAPQRGPTGVVRALTSVRAHGERDTAAALSLAARQFPAAVAGRRVVVLYTTASDAGGGSAEALAARFRAGGTILVVVGTAGGDPYWPNAASATGGFFAPAGNPVVIPALDQVETTLRGRYLVQFPTPPRLPAQVSVRVGTGDLTLTADPIVTPAPASAPPSSEDSSRIWVVAGLGVAAAGLVFGLVVAVVRWRRRRSPPAAGEVPDEHVPDPTPPPSPASPMGVARGRAAVPGTVARGRAIVRTKGSRTPPE